MAGVTWVTRQMSATVGLSPWQNRPLAECSACYAGTPGCREYVPRGFISWVRPTCNPRQSRLRLTGQPTALRLEQGRELAFAVGRNGSRRIAHRLRPDLGMLVVADYQVRQALGWEGRAALMSRAITMGGYS
jgi:hypothetical protein